MCKIGDLNSLIYSCVILIGSSGLERLDEKERRVIEDASFEGICVDTDSIRDEILKGLDPLGDAFCRIRSRNDRRFLGQIFTPTAIIEPMMRWVEQRGKIDLIVDPGCGSGRYSVAALSRFSSVRGVAFDIDPIATLMTRANASVLGVIDRLEVHLADYRDCSIHRRESERALFIGNPPYVRHHLIEQEWKDWFVTNCGSLDIAGSRLAGLHAYFFLATAMQARPGDIGVFVTSSEWLDVNYGAAIRRLLVDKLGITSLHSINPMVMPFADVATTGVVTGFEVGTQNSYVAVDRVESPDALGDLSSGQRISRERLKSIARWGLITRFQQHVEHSYIELGEIAAVHRGSVTGANKIWIIEDESQLPGTVMFPTVTRAKELFAAGDRLVHSNSLKKVADIPGDLDLLDEDERKEVERFLRNAKALGAADGYVARNRKHWWSVGLSRPAPILATYMARRPPAFVRNEARAHHLNIAHGIYPRIDMTNGQLDALATYLRASVTLEQGRVYAGGLTKYEPKEMERFVIPDLDHLEEWSFTHAGATQ